MYIHTITEKEANVRLDKVLANIQQNESRQFIQQLIKDQLVTVNGVSKKANYICKVHDELKWTIPEKVEKSPILPEDIPLHILYEDEAIAIIDKPKHMIVHPTDSTRSGTMVNALLFHFENLSTIGGEERPGIVHRLDQDTSGLLVIAKNNEAYNQLNRQFQHRTVKRVYEAIVSGHIASKRDIIRAPIGRNKHHRLQRAVVPDGREAETHYAVESYLQDATLIECTLKTGRTHQIRVHMQYIGHPIIGDKIYGTSKNTYTDDGQALFAKKLGFHHPLTNEWMEFTADRPTTFKKLLHSLQ